MADLLNHIYRFFRQRRLLFFFLLAVVVLVMGLAASRIRFEEDISRTAGNMGNDLQGKVLKHLKFSDKLIFDISRADSSAPADPDGLVSMGERLTDSLKCLFDTSLVSSITFRASDSAMAVMMNLVMEHLPVFLEEKDYDRIDSMLQPASIKTAMEKNYRLLASPAGMLLKERIRKDPLGISNLAFARLKILKADENYELYQGTICSSDFKHLLIFVVPANPSSETSQNDRLISGIDDLLTRFEQSPDSVYNLQYFGGTAVAVANARQLKRDIMVSLVIAFMLIFLLTGWYFRSIMVPVLGMLPALFGGTLAMAFLSLIKGSISAISLGIGSVILGLIIDYSLYLVNHFRKKQDMEIVIREMSLSILLCGLTSAGAFLCLTFLHSTVLQDLGWFAAISVTGAMVFALLILPQLINPGILPAPAPGRGNIIDKVAAIPLEKNRWLIAGLLITALAGAWFSRHAEFEKNMSSLNFLTPGLAKAEADLDRISNYKLKNIFLVSTGRNIEEALRAKEQNMVYADRLLKKGIIQGISGAGALISSDSMQLGRINRWKAYWTAEKQQRLHETLTMLAGEAGFSKDAFKTFLSMPDKEYKLLSANDPAIAWNPMLRDWLAIQPGFVAAPTILKVRERDKALVYREIPADGPIVMFDRQTLTETFVENVKKDFDLLVVLSMAFVTLLLIFSFGRLGLGLIAALPMYFGWLITLGFMGITGTRFNIFNIIVSSFVFGLGVDYSILMIRGLQYRLKTGKDDLHAYKASILLSSLTTLIGVGALVFARHPALHSIAMVSVTGIVAVVTGTFVLQPFLFSRLFLHRAIAHRYPITLRIVIKTFVTWGNIVLIAIILMVLGTMITFLLPMKRSKKETLFHYLFSRLSKAYIAFTFACDRKLINESGEDFQKPAIIISNHQSLIETPAFLRLHPKIIILTRTWVYRSPVFGPIARLASYYNVDDGIDEIAGRIREKMSEGYSILIFPEAHRSADQHIQRFHRGAFYLAEKLHADILPVLVFGSGDFLSRSVFWGRPNSLRMKILSRVSPDDTTFGTTYQERTRQFRQFYIREYAAFKAKEGDPEYYRRLLALNYVLKGPVLEWYMRVKMRLENNYELYHRLMPRSGEILDLGCGYGFISYMLMFTSDSRKVTGVDFDADKIEVASNCFSANTRIRFVTADISVFEIPPCNGYLLCDVLHYLEPGKQEALLRNCCRNLLPGGTILVREADSSLEKRHKRSLLTELFSTRSGFNKTASPAKELWFTSASRIEAIAVEEGLIMEIIDQKKITSNNLFALRRPKSSG